MKQQGIAITCDRCGKKGFLIFDEDVFTPDRKPTWVYREGMDLCKKCGEQYDEMIREFFARTR